MHTRYSARLLSLPLMSLVTFGCAADADDGFEHLRFSVNAKYDGLVDNVRYIEDIGTNTEVHGRFGTRHQYRGFTFKAERGQKLQVALAAQQQSADGYRLQAAAPTRLVLLGPAQTSDGLFQDEVASTEFAATCQLEETIAQDGYYMVVGVRQQPNVSAQFNLSVTCPSCQAPTQGPQKQCRSGRAYIEGGPLDTQKWDRCETVLLEPAYVRAEKQLTIAADVNVLAGYYITDFHAQGFGETSVTVEGTLKLESTAEHPVVFDTFVPGKEWAGLVLDVPTTLEHFSLRNSHQGILVQTNDVRIAHAAFSLNRVGVRIPNKQVNGFEVEDSDFSENQQALVLNQVSNAFVVSSRFRLNESAIALTSAKETFLDDLTLEENGQAISILNSVNGIVPEDTVWMTNLRVRRNGTGVLLTNSSGVIDGGEFIDQDGYAIQVVGNGNTWQKIKNLRVEGNARACTEANIGAYSPACAALSTSNGARTVFRNNVVKNNHGLGISIVGVANNTLRGYDPAVLNSRIESNHGGGIAFVNAAIFSVEFNTFKGNEQGTLVFLSSVSAHRIENNKRLHCSALFGHKEPFKDTVTR